MTAGIVVLAVTALLAVAAVAMRVRDDEHPQRLRKEAERRGAM